METPEIIGIIAGNGIYPSTFVRAAKNAGVGKIVVAGFHGETEGALGDEVQAMEWFRVGQLGKMIDFFKREGVCDAVMVGQIAPGNLFSLRPDFRILKMLAQLKQRNAESIFGGIADELSGEGIELMLATTFLEDLLAPVGHIFGKKPDEKLLRDAEFGFGIAKEVSRLDIGQTVVVRNGTVLAVEGFEGTNAAIQRGGELGKKGVTVVKVSKPKQDLRFDVPVVGAETIEVAADANAKLIVVEAEKTLFLDRENLDDLCLKRGVTVFGMESGVA